LQPSKNLENQRSTASKKPERGGGGIRAGGGQGEIITENHGLATEVENKAQGSHP